MAAPITEDKYIRVRTEYYKIVQKPTANGGYVTILIRWKYGTIVADHGADFAKAVPHYDDFIVFPDNISTTQVVDGRFWNRYHPMRFTPEDGAFPHIDQLVEHIFGEQKELGYDYLQLLYLQPMQKLPVLVLVSKERNTGKSTFLHFLHIWFGDNVTFNTNEDFNSQFNADWAGKLLVCVDEAMLSKREIAERIKNLSTSPTHKVESKGKDKYPEDFIGKFVFSSNNIDNPLYIEPGETRFWVREVPRLQSDDVDFLAKLEREIPHLMYHLLNRRKLSVPRTSRMYFDPKLLFTFALQRIMMNSRSPIEAAIYELCSDLLAEVGSDSFSFVSGDLRAMLQINGIRCDDSGIRNVLKNLWNLQPRATPSTYQQYTNGMGGYTVANPAAKGRYYTVTKVFLQNLYENCRFVGYEDKNNENQEDIQLQECNDLPF